jgi:hypothetical protein
MAHSVIIDNRTSSYLKIAGAGRYVDPGLGSAMRLLTGTQTAEITWNAPPGVAQSSTFNPLEQAQITFYEDIFPPGFGITSITKVSGLTTNAVVQIGSFISVGGENQIDFTIIPATYSILELYYDIRSNIAGVEDFYKLQLNADATDVNYAFHKLHSISTAAPTNTFTNARVQLPVAGNTTVPGFTGYGKIIFPRYADSHFVKKFSVNNYVDEGTTMATVPVIHDFVEGFWNNTVAINELTLILQTGTMIAGSWAALYGLI